MPFPDASFDAVTNVYLFHEMPKEARRNAARELARVLKPGGKLFFVDSAQVGDGKYLGMEKAFDQALERFPQFNHEPYYRDYSLTDLNALFGEFGLIVARTATPPPSRGCPSAARSRSATSIPARTAVPPRRRNRHGDGGGRARGGGGRRRSRAGAVMRARRGARVSGTFFFTLCEASSMAAPFRRRHPPIVTAGPSLRRGRGRSPL